MKMDYSDVSDSDSNTSSNSTSAVETKSLMSHDFKDFSVFNSIDTSKIADPTKTRTESMDFEETESVMWRKVSFSYNYLIEFNIVIL